MRPRSAFAAGFILALVVVSAALWIEARRPRIPEPPTCVCIDAQGQPPGCAWTSEAAYVDCVRARLLFRELEILETRLHFTTGRAVGGVEAIRAMRERT